MCGKKVACTSSFRSLDQGVPQGSVLGPLLYSMYTSPIARIISRYGLKYHLYADDSQLYISFKTDSYEDLQMVKAKIEMCVKEINAWLVHNGLTFGEISASIVLKLFLIIKVLISRTTVRNNS